MVDWPSYNRSLVRRGEILFSYDFLDIWDDELQRMNKNKKGKPFIFPDSFILVIGYIRCSFHLPYRQTEGIINATGKTLPANPSYGHICKRINKLNIDIKREDKTDDDNNNNKYIIIAIDSTGIKITNRGQWMDEKWNVQNRKRGYLKIHVAVNIKTKEILTLEVTDEKVHDSTMLRKLINHVLDISDKKIESVLADGAHDTNRNFRYLEKKGITPGIKVRKNSIISARNNRLRNREVRLQTKDLLKWKTKRKYGNRWIAETSFSTIKRMFGSMYLLLGFKLVKEMMIKVSLYNLFRRI
jgi:hypothetical protein